MILEKVVDKKDAAGRDHSKWSVNGEGEYGKQEIVIKTVEFVLPQLLKSNSLADAVAQFNEKAQCTKNPLVCDAQPKLKKYDEIVVSDGTSNHTVYAMNWLESDEALVFIDKVNTAFSNIPTSAAPAQPAAAVKPAAEPKPAAETKPAADPKPAQTATVINLETLISAALADGVVTEKERAVLIKKVKDAGGDVDEFELLLDARIFEAQQKAEKATKETKPMAAEASATAEAGTSKKKDPFFADMVKVEGTFTDFYISKYQVTQAQWIAVMGNNPSSFQNINNPVEKVSWEDCQLFLKKLNELTGKNYRLPTEAEWQFAATGGQKSKNFKYAGSNDIRRVAWYDGNSGRTTHPVGQKQPNELGLYDMTGNVSEWCEDWYDEKKTSRVVRGGSWFDIASRCEVSYHSWHAPSDRYFDLGFRLAL